MPLAKEKNEYALSGGLRSIYFLSKYFSQLFRNFFRSKISSLLMKTRA